MNMNDGESNAEIQEEDSDVPSVNNGVTSPT